MTTSDTREAHPTSEPQPTPRFSVWRTLKWLLVPRFSLRSLMIAITAISIVLGVWCERAERQLRVCEQLSQRDAGWSLSDNRWAAWLPDAIRNYRGGHYFYPVESVSIDSDDRQPADTIRLCQQLPRLDELDASSCKVSVEVAKEIGKLRSLTDLDLSDTRVDDDGLAEIAGLTRLRQLLLSDARITGRGMTHLARMGELRTLLLNGTLVDDQGMAHLGRLKKIEKLWLRETPVSGHFLADFDSRPRFVQLELYGSNFDDSGAAALAECSNLADLDLRNTLITDAGAKHLGRLPKLTTLDIGGCDVGSDGVAALASCPSLVSLEMNGTRVDEDGLLAVVAAPKLLRIRCARTPITPRKTMAPIRANKQLDWIFFSERVGLNQNDVLILDGQPSVAKDCYLRGCQFDIEHWRRVAQCKTLTSIQFGETNIDDESVAQLATLPVLEGLFLDGCPITDAGAIPLGKIATLESLDLSKTHITDETLISLAKLPALVHLNVAECPAITDRGVEAISKIKTLASLNLSRTSVTPAGIQSLKRLVNLTELALHQDLLKPEILAPLGGLANFQSLCVDSLADSKWEMESWEQNILLGRPFHVLEDGFSVDRRIPLTRAHLEHIAKAGTITDLNLSDHPITDEDFELFDALGHASHIILRNTKIGLPTIERVIARPELVSLDLERTAIDDAALPLIARCKSLKSLDLAHTKITDDGLAALANMPPLRDLRLAGCRITFAGLKASGKLNEDLTDLDCIRTDVKVDDLPEILRLCPRLESLSLAGDHYHSFDVKLLRGHPVEVDEDLSMFGSAFRDEHLEMIPVDPRWEEVELSDTSISGAALARLAPCRGLRLLRLSGMKLSENDLDALRHWPALDELELDDCAVTSEGLKRLRHCQRLKSVLLRNNPIDDNGMAIFAELPALTKVDLEGTAITNEGLKPLMGLRRLRSLDLSRTQVTEEGLHELRRALPKCVVVIDFTD